MTESFTILIIDDNPDDRDYYIRSLKKVPNTVYRCFEVAEGAKGLEIADTHSFDCVLLDYSLPGMNGLDILRNLRVHHLYLPVVFLTGQGNEALAVEAIKEGAHDYLSKSTVNSERLHHTICAAIGQSCMKRNIAEKDAQIREKTETLEKFVTELESIKHAQENLITKLTESNSELERFAYVCSHDLQEPLRMISSFTQQLQKHLGAKLDEKGLHYMKYITDGSEQARRLINDVLDYARIENESELFHDVESEAVLASVLRDLSTRIEETGAVVTHDVLPVVYMQSTHLRQVLQNLIGNALKFCVEKPHIHIGVVRDGNFWRFGVRDNGIGIAPEHMHKIFSIFQRLHNRDRYPGTGIGLALCKKVVQKYDGKIWVESKPGQGSTFFFTLPISASQKNKAA